MKIRSEKLTTRLKGLIVAHAIIKKTLYPAFMEIISEELDQYLLENEEIKIKI